jgi:hypothetical protein
MSRPGYLVALVLLLLPSWSRAESLADYPFDGERRVRTSDARLQSAIDHGMRFSPTFQDLVDRLERSDVVVYVEADPRSQDGLAGRLLFISAQGGTRYVLVRVAVFADRAQQIAILGHELRHAVEVADAPAIVDRRSLERAYERFGYENPWSLVQGRAFDTHAAVDTGLRVLREIRTGY